MKTFEIVQVEAKGLFVEPLRVFLVPACNGRIALMVSAGQPCNSQDGTQILSLGEDLRLISDVPAALGFSLDDNGCVSVADGSYHRDVL